MDAEKRMLWEEDSNCICKHLSGVQEAAVGGDKLRAAGAVLHVLNAGAFHWITLRKRKGATFRSRDGGVSRDVLGAVTL